MNKGKDIHEYIELALDTGFCHIDTAQGNLNSFCHKFMLIFGRIVYRNEQAVATAIRESGLDRSELFITTKYDDGIVEDRIRESLNKVCTDMHLSWIILSHSRCI